MTNSEEFKYAKNGDGSITVEKYIGNAENIIIPKIIDDLIVTEIEKYAFESCNL